MSVKPEIGKFAKLVRSLIIVFLGYLIIVLGQSLWDIRQAYQRIDTAEYRLQQEKARQKDLLAKLDEATSSSYVERVARDDLNMHRGDETIVLIPEESGEEAEARLEVESENRKQESKRNWEKWWDLVR